MWSIFVFWNIRCLFVCLTVSKIKWFEQISRQKGRRVLKFQATKKVSHFAEEGLVSGLNVVPSGGARPPTGAAKRTDGGVRRIPTATIRLHRQTRENAFSYVLLRPLSFCHSWQIYLLFWSFFRPLNLKQLHQTNTPLQFSIPPHSCQQYEILKFLIHTRFKLANAMAPTSRGRLDSSPDMTSW